MDDRILIFASNFAGIIGSHPFQHQSTAVLNLWKKHYSYKEAERRHLEKIKSERELMILECEDKAAAVQEKIGGFISSCEIESLDKRVDELLKDELESKSPEIKEIVETNIKSYVRMELGKIREPIVQEEIKAKDGNKEFYKRYYNEIWGIGGKVDGFDKDGNIVEIKNRRNRIYSDPPIYDIIQIGCYLWILNKDLAFLHESLVTTGETKVTSLLLNSKREVTPGSIVIDKIMEECFNKMTDITPRIQNFLNDPDRQDTFLSLMKEGRYDEADVVF